MVFTSAWYTDFELRHLFCRGQLSWIYIYNHILYLKLSIADRVPVLKETEPCITIKDHKSYFPNRIPCDLINLSKWSIGKISKVILDRINGKISSLVVVNQWKNTLTVLKWYNKIPSKTQCSFINLTLRVFIHPLHRDLWTKLKSLQKPL